MPHPTGRGIFYSSCPVVRGIAKFVHSLMHNFINKILFSGLTSR
jgi:hypothetical protein